MKTKTINLYEFHELSETAKKKALESLYLLNVEYNDWWRFTVDEIESELEAKGFEGAKVYFSGFSSQGDGACFEAEINLEKFTTDKRLLALAAECSFRIDKNSYANHYSHEKTRFVEYNSIALDRHTRIAEALQNLSDKIEAERLSLSREIYKRLNDEFDYLTSDKAIIETIEANGYTFTESGKLEN